MLGVVEYLELGGVHGGNFKTEYYRGFTCFPHSLSGVICSQCAYVIPASTLSRLPPVYLILTIHKLTGFRLISSHSFKIMN